MQPILTIFQDPAEIQRYRQILGKIGVKKAKKVHNSLNLAICVKLSTGGDKNLHIRRFSLHFINSKDSEESLILSGLQQL